MTETPQSLSYRMPAEWEPHTSTWIAWPHNAEDWPGKFQPIPWVYSEIVRHLSQVEEVNILVNDERAERVARRILTRAGANLARLHFHHWRTDRIWLRDSGPIFVKNAAGDLAITDWKFNAWAKYANWHNDDQIPQHVASLQNTRSFQPSIDLNGKQHRLVLEGGSIDVNGAGTLLTTEECLLSEVQQRNPGVSSEQLEQLFHDYLGIDQVLWLNRGCAGDDTHGHVDDIARFVSTDTILLATEYNTSDENHLPLAENLDRIRSARQPNGQPWNVVELPMPSPVVFDGERLPASYANFYIANGLVLVPTFNDANDRIALNLIAGHFPTRRTVGIHCGDFIWGLGALHCMTQQEPA
ncbi:agmatine deiminase family protein [Terriglobus sp.]|uniref:agmatine deiminase family protein n=1 Tax=Terriglobus sp. TaxID=1889013 RepID=UPI003B00AD0C